jgi:hypothetical protein
MTTVCVTYNTLSLTPLKLLREYERAFQRQKAVSSTVHLFNSSRLGKLLITVFCKADASAD